MPVHTYLDLLTHAAKELGLKGASESLTGDQQQFLLDRLTMLVDSWNLEPTLVPWYQQQLFDLVPGQSSYLIGPNAPDWNAPRPIRLDPNACNLVLLSGAPPVRLPLGVLTVEQFANISIPSLAITFPQAVYLDRSVVTGTNAGAAYTASRISVWGVPTEINQIELFYWQALGIGALNDPVNAAPGYFRLMVLGLAIEAASSFDTEPSALTVENYKEARAGIKNLNAPDMSMQPDPGLPGSKNGGYITRAQFLSGVF